MSNKNKKPYLNEKGERITKDDYDNIKFDKFITHVPKGKKEIIQNHATAQEKSSNAFVNEAIVFYTYTSIFHSLFNALLRDYSFHIFHHTTVENIFINKSENRLKY